MSGASGRGRVVRPAAVAGQFYPSRRADLDAAVRRLLDAAEGVCDGAAAYVVPHAGYVYSGHVAAHVFRRVGQAPPARVLLLGPTHRVGCRGLALPGADAFATPLGEVEIDPDLAGVVAALPAVATRPDVHADEHALEVQLPFLQVVAPGVRVLPVCAGDATPDDVAGVIDAVLRFDPATLVLVSSDLSHYHPDAEARALDAETLAQVLRLDGPVHHRRACGASPLNGLLVTAARRGWRPRVLASATSADTVGDRDRVVGYAAIEFRQDGPDGAS